MLYSGKTFCLCAPAHAHAQYLSQPQVKAEVTLSKGRHECHIQRKSQRSVYMLVLTLILILMSTMTSGQG